MFVRKGAPSLSKAISFQSAALSPISSLEYSFKKNARTYEYINPTKSISARLIKTSCRVNDSMATSAPSVEGDIEDRLLHKKASVRRVFSPNSNAEAMLVCGGNTLAAHASFDPVYPRAKEYIRNHAVGPAVLSPVLISGLIGALIESNFPQAFFVSGNMNQLRPLIVGAEVEADFKVISVIKNDDESLNSKTVDESLSIRYNGGYELVLDTRVKRVSDGAIITHGKQTIWLPDYGNL
mmetsp:Transcript_5270/g.6772  ORF Transcript_5270/g.6772 Transcript_5270/m.6772 type:complete len:238 (+) Transcript_5270:109-822(+)